MSLWETCETMLENSVEWQLSLRTEIILGTVSSEAYTSTTWQHNNDKLIHSHSVCASYFCLFRVHKYTTLQEPTCVESSLLKCDGVRLFLPDQRTFLLSFSLTELASRSGMLLLMTEMYDSADSSQTLAFHSQGHDVMNRMKSLKSVLKTVRRTPVESFKAILFLICKHCKGLCPYT